MEGPAAGRRELRSASCQACEARVCERAHANANCRAVRLEPMQHDTQQREERQWGAVGLVFEQSGSNTRAGTPATPKRSPF